MKILIRFLILLIPTLSFAQGVATHGSSLYFNGSMAISAPYTIYADKIVTLEAWACATQIGNGYLFIRQDGGLPNSGHRIEFDADPAGSGIVWWAREGGMMGASFTLYSINKPRLYHWTHVVATQSAVKAYLYVDGVAQDSSAAWIDFGVMSGPMIGYACWGVVAPFVGYMSQLRYYHRALSLSEIQWNNRHPSVPFSSDSLKMWYKLTEYTGSSVTDYSGNGCTGTIWGNGTGMCLSPSVDTTGWRIDQP